MIWAWPSEVRLPIQSGNVTPLHDSLVSQVDMDTEEYTNRVVAIIHVVVNLFLIQ